MSARANMAAAPPLFVTLIPPVLGGSLDAG